mgnify:CR=1 FL=1
MKRFAIPYWLPRLVALVPVSVRGAGRLSDDVDPDRQGTVRLPPGYQIPMGQDRNSGDGKMSPERSSSCTDREGLDPAHPDASGGRAMALFGPDGVLMVDTENRQVADKTLAAIRSFTDAPIKILVNTHIHQRSHGRQCVLRETGRADLRAGESSERDAAATAAAPRQRPAPVAGGPTLAAHARWRPISYNPATRRAAGGDLQHERRDGGLHPDDAVAHRRRHDRALPQGQRDLHRGLLPQLRLSVCRSGQRRIDQGHARCGRPDSEAGRTQRRRSSPDTARWSRSRICCRTRAMLVDILAKVKTLRDQGKSLQDVLAANLTAPYEQDDPGRHAAEQGSLHHRGLRRSRRIFRPWWTASAQCPDADAS